MNELTDLDRLRVYTITTKPRSIEDESFRWSLKEGAKGVQLAESGIKSRKEKRWLDVPEL